MYASPATRAIVATSVLLRQYATLKNSEWIGFEIGPLGRINSTPTQFYFTKHGDIYQSQIPIQNMDTYRMVNKQLYSMVNSLGSTAKLCQHLSTSIAHLLLNNKSCYNYTNHRFVDSHHRFVDSRICELLF